MDNDLLNYVSDAKALGFKDEQIKKSLMQVGWDEAHINEALNYHSNKTKSEAPETKSPTKNKIGFWILTIFLIIVLMVASYGIYMNIR